MEDVGLSNKIKIIEVDGDKVYLKRGLFKSWRQVHPFKDDKGQVIWRNVLGSPENLLWTVVLAVSFIVMFILFKIQTAEIVNTLNEVYKRCPSLSLG